VSQVDEGDQQFLAVSTRVAGKLAGPWWWRHLAMPRRSDVRRRGGRLPPTGDDPLRGADHHRRFGTRQFSQVLVAHCAYPGQGCDEARVVNRHESEHVVIIAISHEASVSPALPSDMRGVVRTLVSFPQSGEPPGVTPWVRSDAHADDAAPMSELPIASPRQSFYVAAGGEATFRRIVSRFYVEVANDKILGPLYPEGDLGPAEERLTLFLMQYWGGPTTYSDERGHPRLRMRHNPFVIGPAARDAWLRAMRIAIDEAAVAEPYRTQLWDYFVTVAENMMNSRV
jgi:hemoglobin